MAIVFRPLWSFTAVMALLFAGMTALGAWQLERLQWKLGLIAAVNRNLAAPPLTLDRGLALPQDSAQYRRVALTGRFDNAKEAYVFTTGPDRSEEHTSELQSRFGISHAVFCLEKKIH